MLTLKGRSLLFWTLAAIPPVAALALIFGYGVNAPFFDDFLSPGELLIKSARGELSFGDLFAQHNEHRVLFPRLVFLALARGGWNPRSQMLASWVAACLIAWNVFRLRQRGAGLAGSAAALISGVLIFSPLQYQNWTFAMQLMMFLPMLCVTSCLVALRSGMDWRAKLGCCFAAALVSTFSAGSGMLCWAAAIPALLWTDWTDRSNKRVALGVWLGGCAACAAIYFVGYSKPATGSLSFALDEPARALYWSLLFLGSPLAWATEPIAAIASAAAVAACGWLAWRTARADWNAAMPWIIIALYTLGVAASATLARGADGPGQALSARYVTLSIYLLVALVNLAGLWISQGGSRALGPICLAAVLGAHLFACWRAAPWIEQFWRDRRYGRACIVWSGIARNGCLNVVSGLPRHCPQA